jgi:hypothetical protein
MSQLEIVIALNSAAFLITVITSIDSFFKRKVPVPRQIFQGNEKRKVNSEVVKMLLLLLTFSVSVWLLIRQNAVSEREKESAKLVREQELNRADSMAEARINKSKTETIDALAKWGLRIDSTNLSIKRILNTTKRTVNIKYGDDPVVHLCNENGLVFKQYKDNTYTFKVDLCNYLAPSTDIDVNFRVLGISNNNEILDFGDFTPYPKNLSLSKNEGNDVEIYIKSFTSVSLLYFDLKGSYSGYFTS